MKGSSYQIKQIFCHLFAEMVLVPSWDGNQTKTGWWVIFPSMAISTFSSGKWPFDRDEVVIRVNSVLGVCCQFKMLEIV